MDDTDTESLKRLNFSVRQRTVSQKIPDDWFQIALDSAKQIRETFEAAGVEVVVNADQTFLLFYHESKKA